MSYDVIVIGEGVAGLACARRAAQRGLRVASFEALLFGGLVINVNELDPAPGEDATSGAEFASLMVEANAALGVVSHAAAVSSVQQRGTAFEVIAEGEAHEAASVVVASGASLKRLGVPGEADLIGRGVSQCADCDGPLHHDRDVVVIGGGDSALQEALVLAGYCRTVHLVHRRDHYRARPDFVERIAATPAVRPRLGHEVLHILGEEAVTGVMLRELNSGARSELACSGVFAYIGLQANTAFLPSSVTRDGQGQIVTGEDYQTSWPGMWAIGAARAGFGGTLADAIFEAQQAAERIARRIG